MYSKPQLEKYGSFREITQFFRSGAGDPMVGSTDAGGCTIPNIYTFPGCDNPEGSATTS
jgi:hypothetical protein